MIVIATEDGNRFLKRFRKFFLVKAKDGQDDVYLTCLGVKCYMSPSKEKALRFLTAREARDRAGEMKSNCPRLSDFEAVEAHDVRL